ncbi:hypothetical protein AALP_AAs63411U000100, partial [Arabis alpina]
MTSSIVRKIYPPRRFPAGLAPSGQRSMHHNCMLNDFEKMGEAVVGIILKLAARKFNFSGATVTHFLANQLKTERFYEMWSLFGGRPVRFSLNEFEEVTQMNCGEVDANDGWDIDHTKFWEEIGVPVGEGPKWSELLVLFEKIRTWSEEKKRMIALLFILHVGVYGYARDSRIPLKAAKRVMDPEAFERYPWGRVSFQCLISSMQVTDMKKITLHGCVHALLVWIYEAVPILGERFGKRREGGVPMLRWGGGRGRYNLEQVMEEDKKSSNNNKVIFI